MNGALKIWILSVGLCLWLVSSTCRRWYTQNKQRTPVMTGTLPFSSNSTISRPNSSACLRWNGIVRLVDLDMVIAWTSLLLVWDRYVLTLTAIMLAAMALLVCLEIQKCSQIPKNTCGGTTCTSRCAAAASNIDCAHMSYFVRRHCPYLVHFVRLKIECTNLWGLPILVGCFFI